MKRSRGVMNVSGSDWERLGDKRRRGRRVMDVSGSDWESLGHKRKGFTTKVTCGVCKYQTPHVTLVETELKTLAKFIIHQLTTGGYIVQDNISENILYVSNANEPDETLQTPVRICLTYQKSMVCDESRVTMEISFVWPGWKGTRQGYSMVKEYAPGSPGTWVQTHQNGYMLTPPYTICHTIFNRIMGR